MAAENGASNTNSSFSKTICSICYEDLKPVAEDLQSIHVCGHVFHEHCLQQWFSYIPRGTQRTCPVCKQNCTRDKVGRLYFQYAGDSNEEEFNAADEITRLEEEVNVLTNKLEGSQMETNWIRDEWRESQEQLETEVELKFEALNQKAATKKLLRAKCQELKKSQENNMALAKELAALKLVSNLSLEEDEIMKVDSLGRDDGSKETADLLRKALIIRNRRYKELMAKFNTLQVPPSTSHQNEEIMFTSARRPNKKMKMPRSYNTSGTNDSDDEVICYGSVNPLDSSLHIKKETGLSAPLTNAGGNCFSAGLHGSDGTNRRRMRKWCKRAP